MARWLALACLSAALISQPHRACVAQEQPAPAPGVHITFLPPPMEGTLSLGIYDAVGKLVRVLARDAIEKDFTIGLNGLIATWDGRDDAGRPLAKGTYSARGFAVGALEVEGVAMHGNDWVNDDETLRVRRVISGSLDLTAPGKESKSGMNFLVQDTGGKLSELTYDAAGRLLQRNPVAESLARAPSPFVGVTLRDGRLVADESGKPLPLENAGEIVAAIVDRQDVWVIDRYLGKTQVKQYRATGEFLRELKIAPVDPQPVRIAVSQFAEEIMLIEENAATQRVRVLALEKAAEEQPASGDPAVSTWKTVFSKSISSSDEFALIAGKIGRPVPFTPRDKFTVKLGPNPLIKDELTKVDVTIGFDATGSFLKTLDGLTLRRITEATHLKWAVIGEEGSGRQLTIFQGDGAVVEEFKARKLANMMAFDAGEYEWNPAAAK